MERRIPIPRLCGQRRRPFRRWHGGLGREFVAWPQDARAPGVQGGVSGIWGRRYWALGVDRGRRYSTTHGPTSANFDRFLLALAQVQPISIKFGPPAHIGPNSANVDQGWGEFWLNRANFGRVRPVSDRCIPIWGLVRPMSGRFPQKSGGFDQIRQTSTKIVPTTAHDCPNSAQRFRLRQNPGRIRPYSG